MKSKVRLIIIILLFFVICILFWFINSENHMASIEIISKDKAENIIADKKNVNLKLNLLYNDNEVPYAEKGYLLSITSNSKKLNGSLSIKNDEFNIYIIKNDIDLNDIIENNDYLELLIFTKNEYDIKKLFITSLSVMNISFNETDEVVDITLYDNMKFKKSELVDISSLNGYFKQRGATSGISDKKSYRLELTENKSLLNMRRDDDWILNSLFLDETYMREKVAYEIWNDISEINNHYGEYVELIINNEYKGLYLLQERVDHKTFEVNSEENFLYSIRDFKNDRQVTEDSEVRYTNDVIINEFSLEKSNDTNFDTMKNNLIKLDEFFINGKNDDLFYYNINNFLEYNIFINLVSGADNVYKNTKLMLVKNEQKYELTKTPWDLDMIMRNRQLPKEWVNDENKIFYDLARNSNYFENDDLIVLESSIYNNLKEEFYDEKYIKRIIKKYSQQLIKSGSLIRDVDMWGVAYLDGITYTEFRDYEKFNMQTYLEAVEYIEKNLINRIEILDNFY